MVMEIFAGQHTVHIRITARTEQIVQAPTMFINAIARQAVIGDGHQGPQKRQVRPQPVMGTDMSTLQLPRARCP